MIFFFTVCRNHSLSQINNNVLCIVAGCFLCRKYKFGGLRTALIQMDCARLLFMFLISVCSYYPLRSFVHMGSFIPEKKRFFLRHAIKWNQPAHSTQHIDAVRATTELWSITGPGPPIKPSIYAWFTQKHLPCTQSSDEPTKKSVNRNGLFVYASRHANRHGALLYPTPEANNFMIKASSAYKMIMSK